MPCAFVNGAITQSQVTSNNFTSNYSMEYYNYIDDANAPRKLRITLRSNGVNTSSWSENNITGYYMGLALGSDDLRNTSMVTCDYIKSNNSESNSTILCKERYSLNET